MKVWRKFDPEGTKFIPESDLPMFLMTLRPPLGVGQLHDDVINRIVEELDIPITVEGNVYFPDVLLTLGERVYEVVRIFLFLIFFCLLI